MDNKNKNLKTKQSFSKHNQKSTPTMYKLMTSSIVTYKSMLLLISYHIVLQK
jgi:hypothetical protein